MYNSPLNTKTVLSVEVLAAQTGQVFGAAIDRDGFDAVEFVTMLSDPAADNIAHIQGSVDEAFTVPVDLEGTAQATDPATGLLVSQVVIEPQYQFVRQELNLTTQTDVASCAKLFRGRANPAIQPADQPRYTYVSPDAGTP